MIVEQAVAHCLLAQTSNKPDPSMETFVTAFHAQAGEAVCFDEAQVTSAQNRSKCAPGDPAPTLSATGRPAVALSVGAPVVRRLTPTERERLQGFPDGYSKIPSASVGARNAALGNSMAVPVMRWIGERIALADRIVSALHQAPLTRALGVRTLI